MIAIVINFSGNVGKSTVARHLLAPRLKAKVFPVESINSDGSDDEKIKGKHFAELMESLSVVDNAVVDVGSSNVEEFIKLMGKYRGSHEDFDYFVVPTVAKQKQQTDTVATIEELSKMGVPANKIRLVFNMVEDDENPEKAFAGIYCYHGNEKTFTLNPNALITVNDLYGKIKNTGQSIKEIVDDKTDLKEKLKNAASPDEKVGISQQIAVKRLAAGVLEELDSVYSTLFH